MGVEQSSISYWELGDRNMSDERMGDLARVIQEAGDNHLTAVVQTIMQYQQIVEEVDEIEADLAGGEPGE